MKHSTSANFNGDLDASQKKPTSETIDILDDDVRVGIASSPVLDSYHSPEGSSSSRQWLTTKLELYSFYVYYIGNNGLSGFKPFCHVALAPSAFSLFLEKAETVHFSVSSIVLVTNGISFAIQAALFLFIGAWADYGCWRPSITIMFTLLAVAVSLGWLGVTDPSSWKAGVVLYVLGLISYQGALTFWTAAFPGLARNLPEVRESEKNTRTGAQSLNEHATFESLQRNRISNVSFAVSSVGEVFILVVMVGILKGLKADQSVANNTRAFSAIIAFSGGVWLLCALPWFIIEKRRPGLQLPPGVSLLTVGLWQAYVAMRECVRLKQTFLYLCFYFIMGDCLNTSVTVIGTLQNSVVSYSTLQLTLLLIVGIVTQALGIYLFWLVQKRYHLPTKTMLSFNVFWILLLQVWGLIGVNPRIKFGFKNVWEIWLYQALYGLLVCPWYAYSQTMISEVSPLPQMFLFFALFSIVGKTSAFIGPFVSSAIIQNAKGNNNSPFIFLLTMGVLGCVLLYFLNVEKARQECDSFVAAEVERKAFGKRNDD